ncbi:MAG: methyltransferase domain-containing protein, partial [Planctomycetota bacterium]|nr:methyltransferase domain-containing protein [Planctomycetota bacterium]
YRLHFAGRPQDPMLMQYLASMIRELGLEDAVTLDGWVEDPRAWLGDKHYLISASLGEGLPAGILEAMAAGLKPVIHTWPGARHFFPPQWLWRDADEFCRCFLDGEYEPRLYRDWVAERYSLRSQLGQFSGLFTAMEREPWQPDADTETGDGEAATQPKGVPDATNAPETRNAERFYDQWYAGAVVHEGRYQQARREQVVAALAALDRRDLAIIDLGCGLGQLEPHLLPFGQVTGVDLSHEAVQAAQQHCPAATFVCGDMRTMLLPRGAFDVITSVEVLEHFEDADQAHHVARAHDLLAPGGLLVLTTPNRPVMEALNAECLQRDGRPWTDQPIENWLDADALRALADEAGFAVQRLQPFIREGEHDGLHLVLVARKVEPDT